MRLIGDTFKNVFQRRSKVLTSDVLKIEQCAGICFTVRGISQDMYVGWSSPDGDRDSWSFLILMIFRQWLHLQILPVLGSRIQPVPHRMHYSESHIVKTNFTYLLPCFII